LEVLRGALYGSEQRLEAIVNSMAEAVTIRGVDDQLIYANQAALDRLGVGSVGELRAADPHALMEPFETTGEDGGVITMEDLPSMRALRGEEPAPLMVRSLDRRTGRESWVLL